VKNQSLFRRFVFGILLVTAWASCGEKPRVEERKMIDLMCDVMLMEAGNQITYNYANLPESVWQAHYNFVCSKHKVAYADFKAELLRLKEDPEAFSALMEKVITQMQLAELNARKERK
jgi:hypothetical protein